MSRTITNICRKGSDGTKLLPSVKAAWLKDLRSREFRRGRGALFSPGAKLQGLIDTAITAYGDDLPDGLPKPDKANGTFCCLGVLACSLGGVGYSAQYGIPSYWDGTLEDSDLDNDIQEVLIWMNDGAEAAPGEDNPWAGTLPKAPPVGGLSFGKIANWIEENL